MKIEDFILKLENEYEDIPKNTLRPETRYREVFEWNSVNALILIALVSTEYDVTLNADDIRSSQTIQDIFNIIVSRCKK